MNDSQVFFKLKQLLKSNSFVEMFFTNIHNYSKIDKYRAELLKIIFRIPRESLKEYIEECNLLDLVYTSSDIEGYRERTKQKAFLLRRVYSFSDKRKTNHKHQEQGTNEEKFTYRSLVTIPGVHVSLINDFLFNDLPAPVLRDKYRMNIITVYEEIGLFFFRFHHFFQFI